MVTRSSLVWVMTGIAAGIAGGWLWNRERGIDVTAPIVTENRSEPIRSPFAQRREERGNYLESPRPTTHSRAGRAQRADASSEFSHRQSIYENASRADRDATRCDDRGRTRSCESARAQQDAGDPAAALCGARRRRRHRASVRTMIARQPRICLRCSLLSRPSRRGSVRAQLTNPAERYEYLNAVAHAWVAAGPGARVHPGHRAARAMAAHRAVAAR